MPDIMHLVRFNVAPERLFEALTTAEGIRRWWTPDSDFEARIGGLGEFRFMGGGSVHRVTVVEYDPPRRTLWRVTSTFLTDWADTSLSFDIRDTDGGCELLFAQRGYPRADEVYALCTSGWGIYFSRLQHYLETGEDMTQ